MKDEEIAKRVEQVGGKLLSLAGNAFGRMLTSLDAWIDSKSDTKSDKS